MKTRTAILIAVVMLFLSWGSGGWTVVYGQTSHLEHVGGSEVELLMFLKSGEYDGKITRAGSLVGFGNPEQGATYTVQRGLVVHCTFHQVFDSEADALAAFEEAKAFLEERGLEMQVMRGQQHYRLMTGEGNGLRSTLVITAAGGRYRLNVELVSIQ
jgi:hypothetical protein